MSLQTPIPDDSQITLAVTLPDDAELKQSIDMGASLDRDGGQDLVATGTTWVANFDRLGVQVTLDDPNVDNLDTFKSTVEDGGDGGTVVIGNETVTINAGESLEDIATDSTGTLSLLDPAGSATYDGALAN